MRAPGSGLLLVCPCRGGGLPWRPRLGVHIGAEWHCLCQDQDGVPQAVPLAVVARWLPQLVVL